MMRPDSDASGRRTFMAGVAVILAVPQFAAAQQPRSLSRVGILAGGGSGFVAKHRLPTMYLNRALADAGGLMSYGPSVEDLWRRAAEFVAKILKGAKPADLPVDQPTRLELVINLNTARALGLTIPPSLLLRADHVIQ